MTEVKRPGAEKKAEKHHLQLNPCKPAVANLVSLTAAQPSQLFPDLDMGQVGGTRDRCDRSHTLHTKLYDRLLLVYYIGSPCLVSNRQTEPYDNLKSYMRPAHASWNAAGDEQWDGVHEAMPISYNPIFRKREHIQADYFTKFLVIAVSV